MMKHLFIFFENEFQIAKDGNIDGTYLYEPKVEKYAFNCRFSWDELSSTLDEVLTKAKEERAEIPENPPKEMASYKKTLDSLILLLNAIADLRKKFEKPLSMIDINDAIFLTFPDNFSSHTKDEKDNKKVIEKLKRYVDAINSIRDTFQKYVFFQDKFHRDYFIEMLDLYKLNENLNKNPKWDTSIDIQLSITDEKITFLLNNKTSTENFEVIKPYIETVTKIFEGPIEKQLKASSNAKKEIYSIITNKNMSVRKDNFEKLNKNLKEMAHIVEKKDELNTNLDKIFAGPTIVLLVRRISMELSSHKNNFH